MYRAHLRSENGISTALHISGIFGALVSHASRFLKPFVLTHLHCRHKTADTYSDRAEIVYLVYLKHGVELARAFKYLVYLIGSDRVKSAAEGVELYHLKILTRADKLSRTVQS